MTWNIGFGCSLFIASVSHICDNKAFVETYLLHIDQVW